MTAEKGAWEREVCTKHETGVEEVDEEDEDDANSFDYNWGLVHLGKRHDTHRGQRHEAKVGRVNDHSSAVVGIDTGRMRGRLCSHSDACAAGVGDSMKVPDGGKVIVGQEAYRLARSISSKPDSP